MNRTKKNTKKYQDKNIARKVRGVGINDAGYPVFLRKPIENDPTKRKSRDGLGHCVYYMLWSNMLDRCYSEKYLKRHPTYVGCSVCDDWKLFSNFRKWVVEKEEEISDCITKYQLDKDICSGQYKIYSPETCVLVHTKVNSFLAGVRFNGDTVCVYPSSKYKWQVNTNDCFGGAHNTAHHNSEEEAFKYYIEYKKDVCCRLFSEGYMDEKLRATITSKFDEAFRLYELNNT